jgi:hypothetical protein
MNARALLYWPSWHWYLSPRPCPEPLLDRELDQSSYLRGESTVGDGTALPASTVLLVRGLYAYGPSQMHVIYSVF